MVRKDDNHPPKQITHFIKASSTFPLANMHSIDGSCSVNIQNTAFPQNPELHIVEQSLYMQHTGQMK
jgi:hypothetical protein